MKKFLILCVAVNVLLGALIAGLLGGMLFLAETTPFDYSSRLYGLQTTAETWRLRLSRDEMRRAEFALKLVDRRLAELAQAKDPAAIEEAALAVNLMLDEALRDIDAAPVTAHDALFARFDQLVTQASVIVKGLASHDSEAVSALSLRLTELQAAETREALVALAPPAPTIAAEIIPFLSRQVEHTTFPLEGAHVDVACEDCHTSGEYKGTSQKCEDCHRPTVNGVYASHFDGACVDCHTVESWEPYEFDHVAIVECESCHMKDRPLAHYNPPDPSIKFLAAAGVQPVQISTPTPLDEDVHADTCSRCHADTADWNNYNFDHFGFSDCASCHLEDDAPDQHYAGQCSNCHTTTLTWEQVWFNHAGFTNCATCHTASTTPHYPGYACATCHTTDKWTQTGFTHTGTEDCTTCHAGVKPSDHYQGACADCHNTENWQDADFDHNGLTDCMQCHQTPSIHWQTGCTNCHQNTEDWHDVDFSHKGLTDCKSCHTKSDHYSGQCSNCHNTMNWQDVHFNHGEDTTCAACHANDVPTGHYTGSCDTCHNTESWDSVSYNHSSVQECADCHSNDLPPDHYSGDCALCHTVTNWQDVSFDHVDVTGCIDCHEVDSPVPHYTGECSLCHNTVSWVYVHQGLDSDCQSCHTYDGHWPGQCSDCHLSTSDWNDYKFDHDGYTDCKSCHERPDDHPRGQCSKCHNTDSWTSDITAALPDVGAPTVAPERPGSPMPTTPPVQTPVTAPSR